MAQATCTIPPPDEQLLQRALNLAAASVKEANPEVRRFLGASAVELWTAAHQAQRDAMYARGRRQ